MKTAVINKRATRYSDPEHHAKYGVYAFLSRKGFVSEKRMDEICQQFCDENGYTERENKKNSKAVFIQVNFGKFANYVNRTLKTQLGQSYFTTKP